MREGERQVSPELNGIRRDHVARYEWAASQLPPGSRIIDIACGVGYGARVLAEAGHEVVAVDCDGEAIVYANEHYAHHRIDYRLGDANAPLGDLGDFDAAVCFETLEHLDEPAILLRSLARLTPLLLASVPNEEVMPFTGQAFHKRHYTAGEFRQLLEGAGFGVPEWYGQRGPTSEVEAAVNGRTLVVSAARLAQSAAVPGPVEPAAPAPEHVVILGLGPSLEHYVDTVKRLGGRRAFSDEVWGINAVGGVLLCDRLFHMDDVRVQEARAAAALGSNIAHMLAWMRQHPGPIMTSQVPEPNDYPGLVAFPLEDVVNNLEYSYFNSTAAYAVAYAIYLGVKKISLFGFDFTYPNAHHAEKGRACVEFLPCLRRS